MGLVPTSPTGPPFARNTDQLMKLLLPAEWLPISNTVIFSRGGSSSGERLTRLEMEIRPGQGGRKSGLRSLKTVNKKKNACRSVEERGVLVVNAPGLLQSNSLTGTPIPESGRPTARSLFVAQPPAVHRRFQRCCSGS